MDQIAGDRPRADNLGRRQLGYSRRWQLVLGANFGEIMELIPGNRLEWVRDLPVKYRAHKGPEEPFIERLEVRTLVTNLSVTEVID